MWKWTKQKIYTLWKGTKLYFGMKNFERLGENALRTIWGWIRSYYPHHEPWRKTELFVTIQLVLSWREKIPNNSWKLYFSEKMAFLQTEGKGMSNICSTLPLITLICLKLREKPLGKVYWPSQWQKSFQFILIPFHGPPPACRTSGPMVYKSWFENQAAEDG